MRAIARRTLRDFIAERPGHKDQPALKAARDPGFAEVSKAVWIKWIGTHTDYDRIDVKDVEYGS